MKQYCCPSCHSRQWVPSAECPDCGAATPPATWSVCEVPPPPHPAHAAYVQLLGDTGQPLTYRREPHAREFGRQLLTRASQAARYARRCQFLLERQGERLIIRPGRDTPCDTIVNGNVLTSETPLNQGDIIRLRGRASGREAMMLVTIFYA